MAFFEHWEMPCLCHRQYTVGNNLSCCLTIWTAIVLRIGVTLVFDVFTNQ